MSRQLSISSHIVDQQRRASNPQSSVWVTANAGSGKTHVLTERVLRLLLAGVRPEEILCLTYTKAAAAEMRRRVSARLAEWALLDEIDLAQRLGAMENQSPTPALLARARTLFAHALETPGGLKINTIHAFCESVLHRFPLEAGVPFDFTVIEESEADDLIRRARETTLAGGLRGDPAVAAAVETLFDLLSDHSMGEAIEMALAESRKLRHVLADRPGARRRLRELVGARSGETRETILADIAIGHPFGIADYATVLSYAPPKRGGSGFEDKLARLDPAHPDPQGLLEAFLTADQTVPKRFPRKALADAEPALAGALLAEAQRLEALAERLNRATLLVRSEALLDVLGAISDRYEADKRARSLLDFDDLIAHIADLFENEELSAWVRYKLDAGISHILVDESQDTNPEQWRVVSALAAEFFAGDSAVERPRTLFAVGDEKQSIYSFQGADPALFGFSGRAFARKAAEVDQPFAAVPLHTSFRTLAGVLAAVDLVFRADTLRQAVLSLDAPVGHQTARAEAGGSVTLWPVVKEPDEEVDPNEWPKTPSEALKSAPRRLAERIAGEIRGWIDERRPLGPRGRAVRPEDVLILVQSRSPLFFELIRALGKRGIPTPGADRLGVTSHISVLDLLALGDVLLNPADDLQLAALLRSPLFDISEDELFTIAADRGSTIWQALAVSSLPSVRDANERLRHWRGRLDFERPFEFYAEVLYRGDGLRRFHGRLGAEVDDVMAEFLELALAHEQRPQPSLQGFLAEMRERAITIKRELAEAAGGVRVMTVHGAKGLEAPIVILADAAGKPRGSQRAQPVFVVPTSPGPLLIHASAKRDHVAETLDFRNAADAAATAEYWRALYVGMTRAEDELYVTGVLSRTGTLEGTWYEAVDAALRDEAQEVADPAGENTAWIYPRTRPATPPNRSTIVTGAFGPPAPLHLPPLPAPASVAVVRPSSAAEVPALDRVYETASEAAPDADAARRTGIALHALLQHLGSLPRADWRLVAQKVLWVLLPDAPERHAELADKAIAILGNPAFAELFGPDSRAELPFILDARRNGAPVRLAGRIDRVLVANGRVLVVDYKSDAIPPGDVSDVPASYLMQVALYAHVASQLFPGLVVQAGILWTALESLMILPEPLLRETVAAFTMR